MDPGGILHFKYQFQKKELLQATATARTTRHRIQQLQKLTEQNGVSTSKKRRIPFFVFKFNSNNANLQTKWQPTNKQKIERHTQPNTELNFNIFLIYTWMHMENDMDPGICRYFHCHTCDMLPVSLSLFLSQTHTHSSQTKCHQITNQKCNIQQKKSSSTFVFNIPKNKNQKMKMKMKNIIIKWSKNDHLLSLRIREPENPKTILNQMHYPIRSTLVQH